ncbi:hypothetical protein P22_3120 [Propionispora sp. 2/2-37]|uniref:N-acetylmuramoyl-L-alanine amidase family protein n=1 Tax=Propionispora sp. 2/2-37 TaxID=1677858 RepID=UPI0006BB61CC|nr:N-acetylmuramoyl-L-alanine amidase [Propionispora sp. 2/2-37]CUH96994.1 hypothetical protein P22_3120 [Propionispora sp. 2/2-37]
MRIIINGQPLPINIHVTRDVLITLRSMAKMLRWQLKYDTAKEAVYISSKGGVTLPASDRLPVIEIPENARLSGKVICLDPGHGGEDTGATGYSDSLEKDNTLAISLLLKNRLEMNGATVLMTREEDRQVSQDDTNIGDLAARIAIAHENHADIYVSIHNDFFADTATAGTSVFHYGGSESSRLAACVQKKLVEGLGTKDRGVRFGSFYILRNNAIPAILIEVAFISNPEEEVLLSSADGRNKAAECIAEGIMSYFKV